ncbi:pimeloyl-ACP methyl ester carboxylesterase [Bradyrhizobium embrapense]
MIAPDLPHYGMSGPGNLDKSPARTMQDMREVVYDLVVNQLKVKQATYLGHSLGGQLILGYALTYPDSVRSLVLEAPAGLEEYPREVTIAPGKTAKLLPSGKMVVRGASPLNHWAEESCAPLTSRSVRRGAMLLARSPTR